MRTEKDGQMVLEFHESTLRVTREHFARYNGIDEILSETPQILKLVHRDLRTALESDEPERERRCEFTSDNVLRILICKMIERETYRGIVVRIDDSNFLRHFTHIHDRLMMDHTTLNKLANHIRPATWQKINDCLSRHAVDSEKISGEKLRLDTTAVETNIHWPTDSGLLWDTYRVLARHIEDVRNFAPDLVGNRRLRVARTKRLFVEIQRKSRNKNATSAKLQKPYKAMIELVEGILEWSAHVAVELTNLSSKGGDGEDSSVLDWFAAHLEHFCELGKRVVDQTRRRVLNDESVPNEEKLFSIFEEHTELLKRGKAGKPIEFGHMLHLQQVEGCFITDYRVFEKKPVEHELVRPAIERHRKLFGSPPEMCSADKGYYGSMGEVREFEKEIEVVSIGKKGKRSAAESERESDPLFKMAQKFRAGIEGSISFLKRFLRLARCFNKGFVHYQSTIGLTVFAHNLLVLVRNTA